MSCGNSTAQYVGPYKLDKTLGKGQTGLVKMGIHCVSGKKVAIKVVNREKLSENVINKVEREIAIMKLIDHPHILGLFDVYENKKYLYLILELISGGELFDYLVKKGRLSPREARSFFRQIVSAVYFCHNHNVCHRDLKPENLLLDEKNNIRVADFGMASLQPEGYLLETSCGSPHYACPEVIRGEKYDGKTADVWSCGVILYALLVGALPFDDDNLRRLLEKVKQGTFHIPPFVSHDAQHLLRGMIETCPKKRLSLQEVLNHKWMHTNDSNGVVNPDIGLITVSLPAIECSPVGEEAEADPDVMLTMNSLGCFRDRSRLLTELMSERPNQEKTVYHLLLRRKIQHPSFDDDADSLPCKHPDAPRKRIDSTSSRSSLSSSIDDVSIVERTSSSGSLSGSMGRSSQRKLSVEILSSTDRPSSMSRRGTGTVHHSDGPHLMLPLPFVIGPTDERSRSLTGESESRMRASGSNHSNRIAYSSSPSSHKNNSTNASQKNVTTATQASSPAVSTSRGSSQSSGGSQTSSHPWRQRLNTLKNSFMGSPRFHRRKMQVPSTEDISNTSSNMSPSMELTKRSWFGHFVSGSSSNVSARERENVPLTLVMNDRTIQKVKAELVETFLGISNLTHAVVTNTTFRCEYRHQSSSSHSVFHGKVVKFKVNIEQVHSEGGSKPASHGNYHVTFHLVAGPHRRFKDVLALIQVKLSVEPYVRRTKPQGDISAYSRELEKYCASAAKLHNEVQPRKTKCK